MAFGMLVKPTRGTALLKSRERRADRTAHEQREMQAALKRDGRVCRFPHCEFRAKKLPIDPAHHVHRGMGGDPKGTRTTRATVIALCRSHHGLWDADRIDIEPLTAAHFDGPASFYAKDEETGRMVHVASETRIGVSETRT